MSPRINLGKTNPALYQGLMALDQQAKQAVSAAGFSEGFSHLAQLRASQINQCAFCIRLHSRDALKVGESPDRLAVLAAWRETQYFSEKERAALELIESVTLVSQGQVPDEIYQAAERVLNAEEIAAIEWLSVVINAWNRVGISSRYPVKP